MPSLGADMDAGTIVEWKVKPGDEVHRGDILAVIDTDKADIDAEVFEDGVIDQLVVPEGQKVPVGTLLATLVVAARPSTAAPRAAQAAPRAAQPAPHVFSPLVRHLAEREHVALEDVQGSGVGGVVTRADVEAMTQRRRISPRARRLAAERGIDIGTLVAPGTITGDDIGEAASTAVDRVAARHVTLQQRTAALMERSNREIPHYFLTYDCELSTLVAWLADRNAGVDPRERVVPAAVIMAAVSRAAATIDGFNGWWQDESFQRAPAVDLGIVVSLRGGGVLVPVMAKADTLTVAGLMATMHDLVERARTGRLRSSELAQPSITVSSLGDRGVDAVYGVIYPPQVALVGVGRVCERPWAHDGLIGARPTARLTLAADHRVSDGHQGSRFLVTVDRLLHDPDSLEMSQR